MSEDFIIPSVFDGVASSAADAVALRVEETKVARRRHRSAGEDEEQVYATHGAAV